MEIVLLQAHRHKHTHDRRAVFRSQQLLLSRQLQP